MHIFALPRATFANLDQLIASIAEPLAQTILMIETGKELFVDGKRAEGEPRPYITVDKGYCKIATYVTSGNIRIIIPHDMNGNIVLRMIIDRLSSTIAGIEEKMGGATRLVINSPFNSVVVKYVPTPPSLFAGRITDDASAMESVERRVFIASVKKLDKDRKVAFEWYVQTYLPMGNHQSVPEWIAHHTSICIDLTGRCMLGVKPSSHAIVKFDSKSPMDILRAYGVLDKDITNVRLLVSKGNGYPRACIPLAADQAPPKSSNHTWDATHTPPNNVDGMVIIRPGVSKKPTFIELGRLGEGDPTENWINLLAKADTAPIDEKEECQFCRKKLWGGIYGIKAGGGPGDARFIGICSYCIIAEPVFPLISGDKLIYRLMHPRILSDVALDQYGLNLRGFPCMRIEYTYSSDIVFIGSPNNVIVRDTDRWRDPIKKLDQAMASNLEHVVVLATLTSAH